MKIFVLTKKSGPFLDPFLVQNLAIFAQKSGFWTFSSKPHIRFVWNLVRNWDICFESSNGSVVSGKILVLAVLAIFGSKIHCLWLHYMFLGCFWSFSSKPFMIFFKDNWMNNFHKKTSAQCWGLSAAAKLKKTHKNNSGQSQSFKKK